MAIDITALYCCLDDFCKLFEEWEAHRFIPAQTARQRPGKLSRSEMLFTIVLFHLAPFKHLKGFYDYGGEHHYWGCFGTTAKPDPRRLQATGEISFRRRTSQPRLPGS